MDESPASVDEERHSDGFGDSRAQLWAATEELADAGGWELDVRTQTLRWTDGTRRIHEVGAEYEPTLESALSYYHPDERPRMAAAVEAAIEDEAPFDETVRLVTDTDDVRWVRVRGEPVTEDGETVRVYGALRDVTELKQRERTLRTNAAKLEALTAAFPDLAFLFNGAGRCLEVYANEDNESLLTRSPAAIRGETVTDMLPAEPAQKIVSAIERALETEATQAIEYRLDVRAGTRWFEGRIAPLTEPTEEGEGVVMVTRDVTDRHETEARLRERKAHLRNAQAVADVGSWIRDVPDDEIWWSDEVYNIFGRSRADGSVDHEEFMSFVHPADREQMADAWNAALEGDTFDVEHRIVVDGETKWVREKAEMEFDADGQPQQAIGVVQDVTERKAYEQQLEAQNEQLAVLNRIMRHDLRNKMSVILGYAEELDERFDGEPSSLATRLRTGAEELLAISEEVHDLRDLFENDATLRALELSSLVDDAVEAVRREHRAASYVTAVPDGLRVQAVPALQVALTNLVENAIVHNDSEQPRVAVAAEEADETVTVTVTDNGPGIPETEYEHLTGTRERTQLDHTSGLGLWAVRWIVSNCDGAVQFETAGDGTTVRLRLHRAASSA
ncbi:PAS domain-containing protein [Halorientalis brevis]|uniref:histidine kinase n=1 Tax=Halorientalis brevis TaxID=1126241 RepID=A0ABD6C9Z6_9EURY|nr:PAS domain-containing sensor histidine kinase [Halorientalis brevis]